IGGARGVSHSGGDFIGTRHQVFEMFAASHAFDSGGDSLIALVGIIWRYNRNGTARLIHADGDGLPVIQGHGQWVGDVGHRVTRLIDQRRCVDDIAAFAHGGGGGQDDVDLVDGVVDSRCCAVACNFQLLKVTASSVSDLDGLGALVDEHVIARCWDSHSTDGITGFDGDSRAVIQLQSDVGTGLVAQGGGVRNLTTFVNCAWRSQRDSG
ncbi:TPA: hypothetical protein H5X26_005100, partial [Escherichia coli]|nr:hypothetical protein [Escherichia coli]